MNITSLETTDIFRGAFFLCSGGRLADVRFAEDRRTIATFLIEGEDIDQLDLDYRSGQALVNPLLFRETLNHLRDILFKKLREAPASRDGFRLRSSSYAGQDAAAGRRTRYDRKKDHRTDKKRC